jgi:cytoskeletal protein CcmA (bactofilin family)
LRLRITAAGNEEAQMLMFSSKKHSKIEVIIGSDTVVKGEIISKGTVRIDGRLEGSLSADCVIIGEGGNILGDVTAKTMIAAGRLTGNIHSTENVEIQPKGEIFGDIYTQKLSVAEGGVFEGRSSMQKTRELEYAPLEL